MRPFLLLVLLLIPLACTVVLFGFLESCFNMVEMLLVPFTVDRTAGGALVVGGPFLVLFIMVSLGVFAVVPAGISAAVALLGGLGLRQGGHRVSARWAWRTVILAAALTSGLVLLTAPQEGLLRSRPKNRPKSPVAVVALVAGANAALSAYLATRILRRLTAHLEPHPAR
jgi:hypothetical protein